MTRSSRKGTRRSWAPLLLQPGANSYGVDAPLEPAADAALVWPEEFDGDALDAHRWRYDRSRNKDGTTTNGDITARPT